MKVKIFSDIDQLDGNVSVCSSIIQNDPKSCKKLSDHLKPNNVKNIDNKPRCYSVQLEYFIF